MDFLTLMPMAEAFLAKSETDKCYNEKERNQITDELWNQRVRLLKKAGYTDLTRVDRIEDRLAIKPLFVLGRGGKSLSKEKKENQRTLIKYLVSDETSLFLEGDQSFRSEKNGKDHASGKRQADRERHTEPYIEECIAAALEAFSPLQSPRHSKSEMELADAIIRAIAYHVNIDGEKIENKRKGKSMRQWLFKEAHRGIAPQNREEYQIACEKYKIDFPLAPTRTKEKQLIKKLLQKMQEDGKDDIPHWVISPYLLRKEAILEKQFDEYFSDEESKDEFAYEIIFSLVSRYLPHEKWMSTSGWGIVPKTRRTITDAEAQEFKEFEKRLHILTDLETGYLKNREPLLTDQHDFTSFPAAVEKYIKFSEKLVGLVYSFYDNLGISMKHNNENSAHIAWRISGAINMVVKKRATIQNHNLVPIVLLFMIKSCGLNIRHNRLVEVDFPSTLARFRDNLPLGAQRYAEIRFLDNACSFLSKHPIVIVPGKELRMSEEDLFLNYQEYLLRQGWEIKSKQELDFWNNILQNRCEELPLIGFQVKFLEYASHCFPTHFEYLPYKPVDKYRTFPNDFVSIYSKKEAEIKKSVDSIVSGESISSEVIDNYKKIWSDFETSYSERRGKIIRDVKIPFPLSLYCPPKREHFDIEDFDNNEYCEYYFYYKSIITEMIMQEALNRMAQQKLIDGFSRAYGITLKHALNDSI